MDSKYWGPEIAYKNGYTVGAKDLTEANADIAVLKAALKETIYGLYIALNTYEGPSEDMLYDIAYKSQNLVMEMEAKHHGI